MRGRYIYEYGGNRRGLGGGAVLIWWARFSTVWTKVASSASLLGTFVEEVITNRRMWRGWPEGDVVSKQYFRGGFLREFPRTTPTNDDKITKSRSLSDLKEIRS